MAVISRTGWGVDKNGNMVLMEQPRISANPNADPAQRNRKRRMDGSLESWSDEVTGKVMRTPAPNNLARRGPTSDADWKDKFRSSTPAAAPAPRPVTPFDRTTAREAAALTPAAPIAGVSGALAARMIDFLHTGRRPGDPAPAAAPSAFDRAQKTPTGLQTTEQSASGARSVAYTPSAQEALYSRFGAAYANGTPEQRAAFLRANPATRSRGTVVRTALERAGAVPVVGTAAQPNQAVLTSLPPGTAHAAQRSAQVANASGLRPVAGSMPVQKAPATSGPSSAPPRAVAAPAPAPATGAAIPASLARPVRGDAMSSTLIHRAMGGTTPAPATPDRMTAFLQPPKPPAPVFPQALMRPGQQGQMRTASATPAAPVATPMVPPSQPSPTPKATSTAEHYRSMPFLGAMQPAVNKAVGAVAGAVFGHKPINSQKPAWQGIPQKNQPPRVAGL